MTDINVGASTSSSPSIGLITLPTELLHQIFRLCEPSDLARLNRTHPTLHNYIQHAPHLWKQIYNRIWDEYAPETLDECLALPCPSTRSVTKVVPEWQKSMLSPSVAEPRAEKEAVSKFDYAEQVRRRTWAEKQIARLATKPIESFSNYNDTIRALISIARSRQARSGTTSADMGSLDLSEPYATADYLTQLLTSPQQFDRFRQLVYPRNDVKALQRWQLKHLTEQHELAISRTQAQKRREEKRARSTSSASTAAKSPKRSRQSHSLLPIEEGPSRTPNAALFSSPPRRRSARVQLHAYPPEVHHLLYDKQTHNLITLDDGTGLANLEALEMLDEQLAAELHVLHGVHCGLRAPRANDAEPSGSTQRQDQEEEEEEDTLFVDNGSPAETEDDHLSADTLTFDDNDEDDEDGDHNVFRFFVDRWGLGRRGNELALGNDLGREANTRLRGRAREIVYDTARYGPENSFGPLRAWRERYEPLDGPRLTDHDEEEGEEDDEGGEAGPGDLELGDDDPEVIELIEIDDSSEDGGMEEDLADSEPDNHSDAMAHDQVDDTDLDDEDEEFHEHDDEDDDDDDNSDTPHIFFEIREMAISHSRGLIPYYEAKQRKAIVISKVSATDSSSSEAGASSKMVDEDSSPPTSPRIDDVWRTDKQVNWVLVEAIMIVMHCNIRHAVLNHGWGMSFRLPNTTRSLVGRDRYARDVFANENRTGPMGAWSDMLGLPCGWSHSRGASDARASETSFAPPSDSEKPYDWAGVEGMYVGSYAFLDWSKWASFNARDPLSRGLVDPTEAENAISDPTLMGSTTSVPNLESEREALGDCLQLRMELLPMKDQKPRNEADRLTSYLEGYDQSFVDIVDGDEGQSDVGPSTCQANQAANKYPPLRFRGNTQTYLNHGNPIPRGELYGVVRPIYAQSGEGKKDSRAIVAIHWDITHRYDGEDAWSLSGIQAGPPGSRAPIYGIWGSAARRDNMSPVGPWTYYCVDDRRWKDIEEELAQQDRRQSAQS